MMRWSPGTAPSTIDELPNRGPRTSCNPVVKRHRVSWKRIWSHLAWWSRGRDKGNLRHNFRDCYNRCLQLKCTMPTIDRADTGRCGCIAENFRVPIRYTASDTPRAGNNNHLVIFIVMERPTTIDALTYCPGALPDRLTDCYNAVETSTVIPIWPWGQYAMPIILHTAIFNIEKKEKRCIFYHRHVNRPFLHKIA